MMGKSGKAGKTGEAGAACSKKTAATIIDASVIRLMLSQLFSINLFRNPCLQQAGAIRLMF
jgi:hypothetical protein